MSQTMDRSTAIALIPAAQLPTLISADKNDILGRLRAELDGYTPDGSTEAGRREANAKAKKVGTAKMDFVRLGDTLTESAKATIKGIRDEIKIVEAKCDAMRDAILAPVEAFKEIERSRVAAHEAALNAMDEATYVQPGASSEAIQATLAAFMARPARDWQEFTPRALSAYSAGVRHLEDCLTFAIKSEAEASELAALRAAKAERDAEDARRAQVEHDRRIAAEAAEKARIAAEQQAARALAEERTRAAREIQREQERAAQVLRDAEIAKERAAEAAAKAERDRLAAIAAAEAQRKADADRAAREQAAAIEQERTRAAAERKREADAKAAQEAADAKRAANVAHRKRVNNEALDAIVATGIDREIGIALLTAIAKGSIPHVTIGY